MRGLHNHQPYNPRPGLGLFLGTLGAWGLDRNPKFAILFARLYFGRVVDLDGSLLAVLPLCPFYLVLFAFLSVWIDGDFARYYALDVPHTGWLRVFVVRCCLSFLFLLVVTVTVHVTGAEGLGRIGGVWRLYSFLPAKKKVRLSFL
jgi:hypothetical protein